MASDPIQAAKERLTALAGKPHTTPVRASVMMCQEDVRLILAELSRLEEENADLVDKYAVEKGMAAFHKKLCDQAETALAEARRQIAERDAVLRQVAALQHEDGGRSFPSADLCAWAALLSKGSEEPAVGEKS